MNRKSDAGRVRPMIARIAITSAMALTPIAVVAVPALAAPAATQDSAIVLVDQQDPAIVLADQAEDIHGRPGHGGWNHGGWGRGGWNHGGWPSYPSYPGYWPGYPGIWPGYIPMPSTGSAF